LAEDSENGAEQLRLLVVSIRLRSGAAGAAAAHRIEEAVGEVLLDRAAKSRVVGGVAPAVAQQAPVIHVDLGVRRIRFGPEVGPAANSGDAPGKLPGAGQETERAVEVPLALPD